MTSRLSMIGFIILSLMIFRASRAEDLPLTPIPVAELEKLEPILNSAVDSQTMLERAGAILRPLMSPSAAPLPGGTFELKAGARALDEVTGRLQEASDACRLSFASERAKEPLNFWEAKTKIEPIVPKARTVSCDVVRFQQKMAIMFLNDIFDMYRTAVRYAEDPHPSSHALVPGILRAMERKRQQILNLYPKRWQDPDRVLTVLWKLKRRPFFETLIERGWVTAVEFAATRVKFPEIIYESEMLSQLPSDSLKYDAQSYELTLKYAVSPADFCGRRLQLDVEAQLTVHFSECASDIPYEVRPTVFQYISGVSEYEEEPRFNESTAE
jgi:hypothetical protein